MTRRSPYTVEGRIEWLGDLVERINKGRGWRRLGGKAFIVVILLVPMVVGLLLTMWHLFLG
jgi:hypothetical protein